MTASENDPHGDGGLLAALVPAGVLRQPEVALTTGIWWVLGLEGAAGALDPLIERAGVRPTPGGRWYTEVRGDGGRSDLEYEWGDPARTRVLVEAKIGHTLTPEQVAGYATRLPPDDGMLVVLTPASRRAEAVDVVERCRSMVGSQVRFDVWTYDDVLRHLEAALPGNGDVAQLRGLVRAHSATDREPLRSEDLLEGSHSRRDDIWWIVDQASFGIAGSRLPAGSDWSLEQRRYLPLDQVSVAVGVGRKGGVPDARRPWAWLRLSGSDGYRRISHRALPNIRPGTAWDGNETWLPLPIETGVHGSTAAALLRGWLETLLAELEAEVRAEAQHALQEVQHLDPSLTQAVLGMGPMTAEDLTRSSEGRREDLWLLLSEAARPLYPGRMYPSLTHDPDYELVRYVPIPASESHVATCLGPKPAHDGIPWAWLRVHQATKNADIGRDVLVGLAGSRVIQDPHGWAVPVDIPVGVEGPAMLAAVHDQLRVLVARYAEAIVARAQ